MCRFFTSGPAGQGRVRIFFSRASLKNLNVQIFQPPAGRPGPCADIFFRIGSQGLDIFFTAGRVRIFHARPKPPVLDLFSLCFRYGSRAGAQECKVFKGILTILMILGTQESQESSEMQRFPKGF